jgi:hypothetical protein
MEVPEDLIASGDRKTTANKLLYAKGPGGMQLLSPVHIPPGYRARLASQRRYM